ncbi:anion transporter [Rhodoferax sp. U2-2l]|uniref:SLC13 family permease n=1 Tax=Rhodoferax sp. U2-2l TaxID=2884000 RepID=UPI001D0B0ADE|nr:SLC13 family permease [Rhodoferax sp. U2-2l]MCB8747220.1 anion transporter [Rhodoferax sp. U2-2l]
MNQVWQDMAGLNGGVLVIFVLVYAGMILGGLPHVKLNRAGVALLGAIGVIGIGAISTDDAARSVDLPTMLLLFSFMVVSAQMRLGGFYTATTRGVAALPLGRTGLLGALIAVAGGLSAIFSNDIICLAMTPVVVQLCQQRRFHPVPFLVGLACAANIGSAATLIGNPQNMLIGSVMQLHFGDYLRQAVLPVAVSLGMLWGWLVWGPPAQQATISPTGVPVTPAVVPSGGQPGAQVGLDPAFGRLQVPPFDAWQTAKGLAVATALLLAFLFTDWPREVAALLGAGVLLLSRRFHSSHVMGFVDWELLVLFAGLFVVNHAFASTGLAADAVALLAAQGVYLNEPGPLFVAGVALSNLVSNVPAVMLLLPHVQGPQAGLTLALVSTFAGNLLLVGSIANLIVVDLAEKSGVLIDWRDHARIGVPVTLLSLVVVWLALRW